MANGTADCRRIEVWKICAPPGVEMNTEHVQVVPGSRRCRLSRLIVNVSCRYVATVNQLRRPRDDVERHHAVIYDAHSDTAAHKSTSLVYMGLTVSLVDF